MANAKGVAEPHVELRSFFSFGLLLECIATWIRQSKNSKSAWKATSTSIVGHSVFLQKAFVASFCGRQGLEAIIYLRLFETAFLNNLHIKKVVFLSEGQAWERALCFAGRTIVPNATFLGYQALVNRFWDLRGLTDYSLFMREKNRRKVLPDYYLVPGKRDKRQLVSFGLPKNKIVIVEALNYLHLLDSEEFAPQEKQRGALRACLLGDYSLSKTKAMLNFVENTKVHALKVSDKIFHPHPANAHAFSASGVRVSATSYSQSIVNCEIVIVAGDSSVALDSILLEKHTIVVNHQSIVSGSPLVGLENNCIVSDQCSFDKLLRDMLSSEKLHRNRKLTSDLLCLDKKKTRWLQSLR